MRSLLTLLALVLGLALPAWALPSSNTEPWIDAAAAVETPEWASQAPALVLLDESIHEIDTQGVETQTHHYLVRVLTANGRAHAAYQVYYDSKVGKVKSLRAWLIRKDTKTETRNNASWSDECSEDMQTLASDGRFRRVNFADKAVAGDLFAVETKVVAPLFVSYLRRTFGNRLPLISERMQIILPQGFTLDVKTWGPVTPHLSQGQNTWRWSVANRPYRPEESLDSPNACVDCDLMLRVEPPASLPGYTPVHLDNWSDIARFIERLNAGQCDSSPELASKARELTANLGDPLAKIQALAQYVQKLRYISNLEGLNRGQGLVARKASLVFTRRFGDCKDKANLLRAMLREAGITSYPVGAGIGAQEMIHPEAANCVQFNHAICAIEVDPSFQSPAVVRTEELGSLLLFDPTDGYTQVGDLPEGLQHTFVHIEDPRIKGLLPVPLISPELGHKLTRKALLKLTPEGGMQIEGEFDRNGQQATALRYKSRMARSEKDVDKLAMDELGDVLRTGVLTKRGVEDFPEQNRCVLRLEASTRNFLQRNQGNLIIAKLDVLNRSNIPVFPEKERRTPAVLPALCLEDEIRFAIPADMVLEELPRPASVDHAYGSLRLSFENKDSVVTMHRRLVLNRTLVSVEDYPKLKKFLSDIARSDRSSVLLRLAAPAAAK